jgi:mono/diheme cytochrome c family protein
MSKRNLKLALFTLLAAVAVNGWLVVSRAAQSDLPAGAGVELARAKCLGCHESDLIFAQRLTRAGWIREVEKMTRWGARVSDEEKNTLADYFAAHFAPVKAAKTADNVARGQAIYEAQCLNCHGDELIKQQRLARAGWIREIEKMTRWGAAVKDDEKEPLADYLFKQYGARPLNVTR